MWFLLTLLWCIVAIFLLFSTMIHTKTVEESTLYRRPPELLNSVLLFHFLLDIPVASIFFLGKTFLNSLTVNAKTFFLSLPLNKSGGVFVDAAIFIVNFSSDSLILTSKLSSFVFKLVYVEFVLNAAGGFG